VGFVVAILSVLAHSFMQRSHFIYDLMLVFIQEQYEKSELLKPRTNTCNSLRFALHYRQYFVPCWELTWVARLNFDIVDNAM